VLMNTVLASNQKEKAKIYFIVGIGRSGTTLLTSILNQHPLVLAAPENFFFLFFSHSYSGKQRFSNEDVNRVIKFNQLFGKIQPYIGWEYDEENLRKELLGLKDHSNYIQFSEIIYRNFKIREKKEENIKIYIDKNPSYSIQMNRIDKLANETKFLVAVRDYRANLLSRKQSINIRSGEVVLNCVRWNLFNRFIIRFYNKNKKKCHVVKYEEMVTDSLKKTQEICDFLEINFDENMLNFYKSEGEKLKDETYQKLSQVSDRITKKYNDMAKPINTSRMNAWKKELSTKEIEQADIICSGTGNYFGYEPVTDFRFRKLKKMWIYLTHPVQVIRAYYDIYKDFILYYAPIKWKFNRFSKMILKRTDSFNNNSSANR